MTKSKSRKNEITFVFMFWTIFTMFYFAAQAVFAQAVEVSSAVVEKVSEPAFLDQAQSLVSNLDSAWAVTIAIFLIEILMRAVKTKDPKSLLYVISNILKMIVKVCEFIAGALDKVLQRMKDQNASK